MAVFIGRALFFGAPQMLVCMLGIDNPWWSVVVTTVFMGLLSAAILALFDIVRMMKLAIVLIMALELFVFIAYIGFAHISWPIYGSLLIIVTAANISVLAQWLRHIIKGEQALAAMRRNPNYHFVN